MSTILVTKATLGTINHTVLTVRYMESIGIDIKGIIVNLFNDNNPCHLDNIKMIKELTGKEILAVINEKNTDFEEDKINFLKSEFDKLNPNIFIDAMEDL